MNIRRNFGFGIALIVAAMGLWGCQAPEPSEPEVTEAPKAVDVGGSYNEGGVAPFGMAQRLPKPVDGAAAGSAAVAADGAQSGTEVATLADQNALFGVHCVACHGRDGLGVEPLGVTLVGSPFVQNSSTEQLVAFLKVGRLPDSPDSVKGRVMPGFAWMGDDQLAEIAEFLKVQNP